MDQNPNKKPEPIFKVPYPPPNVPQAAPENSTNPVDYMFKLLWEIDDEKKVTLKVGDLRKMLQMGKLYDLPNDKSANTSGNDSSDSKGQGLKIDADFFNYVKHSLSKVTFKELKDCCGIYPGKAGEMISKLFVRPNSPAEHEKYKQAFIKLFENPFYQYFLTSHLQPFRTICFNDFSFTHNLIRLKLFAFYRLGFFECADQTDFEFVRAVFDAHTQEQLLSVFQVLMNLNSERYVIYKTVLGLHGHILSYHAEAYAFPKNC